MTARAAGTPATSGQPCGCTAEADWQSTIKLMEQFAGVPAGTLSPSTVATNVYLLSGCADAIGKA